MADIQSVAYPITVHTLRNDTAWLVACPLVAYLDAYRVLETRSTGICRANLYRACFGWIRDKPNPSPMQRPPSCRHLAARSCYDFRAGVVEVRFAYCAGTKELRLSVLELWKCALCLRATRVLTIASAECSMLLSPSHTSATGFVSG